MTHTPGPWKIEFNDKGGTASIYGVREDGNNRQSDGFGCLFSVDLAIRADADKPMYPAIDAQQKANALLVAAAPELLTLLKRYRTETPLGHQPHMIAHEADAAISKAEQST